MISLVINISQCEFIKTIANKKGHNTRASQKEVIRLRGKNMLQMEKIGLISPSSIPAPAIRVEIIIRKYSFMLMGSLVNIGTRSETDSYLSIFL